MSTSAVGDAPGKKVGQRNSSITRVRPVFSALLSQNPTGQSWLGDLLKTTESGRGMLTRLNADPGSILEELIELRPFDQGSFGQVDLARCFRTNSSNRRSN